MSEVSIRRGAYPGSFNPPTRAHLELAAAARDQHELERVDLIVSRVTLAKEHVTRPLLEHRLDVLRASVARFDWLEVAVTDEKLMVDIAAGYDVVVMGADKWAQVNDPVFYGGSAEARDDAVDRLPKVAIAPRPPHPLPAGAALDVPDDLVAISSTACRDGRRDWMTAEAAAFDAETGAWTDPERYERLITE